MVRTYMTFIFFFTFLLFLSFSFVITVDEKHVIGRKLKGGGLTSYAAIIRA